jgi:hypothetical protein
MSIRLNDLAVARTKSVNDVWQHALKGCDAANCLRGLLGEAGPRRWSAASFGN